MDLILHSSLHTPQQLVELELKKLEPHDELIVIVVELDH